MIRYLLIAALAYAVHHFAVESAELRRELGEPRGCWAGETVAL